MLFGAMPTAMGSDSFKIHTISEDQRLLISRVFNIPRISSRDMRVNAESLESSDSESQSQYITVRSMDSMNGVSHSKPGCVSSTVPPEAFKRVRNASLQLDDDSEEARPFSPPTASRLSRDRRLQMSHKTSLCEQCRFYFTLLFYCDFFPFSLRFIIAYLSCSMWCRLSGEFSLLSDSVFCSLSEYSGLSTL
ncbi:unnamed protein product [Nippostrongylus brasiliensis]|uniref:Bestrophin 3 n=1 Tax=Nippostrongylus brasiliensis TaxID=27835 RepID=A0A0N4XJ71_NIPBR|nr:unnamed protein product [Nippostrongylus brasiliensis]